MRDYSPEADKRSAHRAERMLADNPYKPMQEQEELKRQMESSQRQANQQFYSNMSSKPAYQAAREEVQR